VRLLAPFDHLIKLHCSKLLNRHSGVPAVQAVSKRDLNQINDLERLARPLR
jgi:hypothetical protein